MAYRRLPYAQYFIDTSRDYNNTGRTLSVPEYRALSYPCTGRLRRLLGIRHEVNFAFSYDAERDVIRVDFERTMGFTDWFANLEFPADYYDAIEFEGKPLQLRVHRGWAEMYLAAKRTVRAEWLALHTEHPEAETEIVGWSLGSGQAMLCAQDLNYNYGLRARVFTFGSVKPFRCEKGGAEPLARYLRSVYRECRNFADVNDIITYMPPFRGCTDLRRTRVQSKKRSLFRLLNPWRYHTGYDDPGLYDILPD